MTRPTLIAVTTLLAVATMTVACGGDTPTQPGLSTSSSVAGPPSPPPPRLVGTPPVHVQQMVQFSGYFWDVTHQPGGAAPPTTVGGFSGRHAWVDDNGRLNLRLEPIGGVWQGGAVVSAQEGWGYGTYEWTVEGRIDGFHENVVVGLFTYEQGAPGNREIDIEIARFGDSGPRNMNSALHHENGESFNQSWAIGNQERTTHAFTWKPGRVTWTTRDANNEIIHRAEAPTTVEPGDERVHMNIWVCCERSPDRPQHVVISSFDFQP